MGLRRWQVLWALLGLLWLGGCTSSEPSGEQAAGAPEVATTPAVAGGASPAPAASEGQAEGGARGVPDVGARPEAVKAMEERLGPGGKGEALVFRESVKGPALAIKIQKVSPDSSTADTGMTNVKVYLEGPQGDEADLWVVERGGQWEIQAIDLRRNGRTGLFKRTDQGDFLLDGQTRPLEPGAGAPQAASSPGASPSPSPSP